MKRIYALPVISILLIGCSNNAGQSDIFLKRPKDTNLEFWITERVTFEQLENKGCTYIPGWMGADEYLGSKYRVNEDGSVPDIHVTYLITGYPDTLDDRAVTSISVTDPEITVYGLKIGAKESEIFERAKKLNYSSMGFVTYVDECCAYFTIKNCTFVFKHSEITIDVPVTNNQGIIY